MHDKRYNAGVEKLRSPERLRFMEVNRVVRLCLSETDIRSTLDVGCGTGLFSEAFVMKKIQVTGIDVNKQMVEEARNQVQDAHFQEGSAEALPFPEDSFDLVFLGHLLHESDDPLTVLKEARRVSKNIVCILEWPYRQEKYGPPLNHRLKFETIQKIISKCGFQQQMLLRLAYMDFYKLFL
jgi:ubiquinone/menaquinone biosynthesis C-methylase UbiE